MTVQRRNARTCTQSRRADFVISTDGGLVQSASRIGCTCPKSRRADFVTRTDGARIQRANRIGGTCSQLAQVGFEHKPVHFGVDRYEFLNPLPAGELAARSELECALCSRSLSNRGRSQRHASRHITVAQGSPRLHATYRSRFFVGALTVLTLIISASVSYTASAASVTSLTPTTSDHVGVSATSPVSGKSSAQRNSGPMGAVASVSASQRGLTTTQRISQLETATRANPKAGEQWRDLGASYVRQAFETADPAFYPLAESSLRRAENIVGATPEIMVIKAGLALARHRFADARAFASNALQAQPEAIAPRIALFDAEVELGHYEQAFQSIDDLVAQRPNVATLSRLSYRRQLSGDLSGAEIAMRQAVSAAPPNSIDRAVALGYLGDVLLESGRLDAASRSYEQSFRLDPANGTAVLGRARVFLAHGDPQAAVALLDRLTDRNPLPGAFGLRAEIARSLKDITLVKASDELGCEVLRIGSRSTVTASQHFAAAGHRRQNGLDGRCNGFAKWLRGLVLQVGAVNEMLLNALFNHGAE